MLFFWYGDLGKILRNNSRDCTSHEINVTADADKYGVCECRTQQGPSKEWGARSVQVCAVIFIIHEVCLNAQETCCGCVDPSAFHLTKAWVCFPRFSGRCEAFSLFFFLLFKLLNQDAVFPHGDPGYNDDNIAWSHPTESFFIFVCFVRRF